MNIKLTCLCFLIVLHPIVSSGQVVDDSFYKKVNALYSRITYDNNIDYNSLSEHAGELNLLINSIQYLSSVNSKELNFQTAFQINVYNLYVLKFILDNYPVRSTLNIPGFFNSKSFQFGEKRYTLSEFSKFIFTKSGNPDIYFCLIQAAKDGIPLYPKAFHPQKFEKQLHLQMHRIINNEDFVSLNYKLRKLNLSKFFNWHQIALEEKYNSLIELINHYRSEKIPKDYLVDFIPFDWRLNNLHNIYKPLEDEIVGIHRFNKVNRLIQNQIEVLFVNELYSSQRYFNSSRTIIQDTTRSSLLSNQFIIKYGFSNNVSFGLKLNTLTFQNHKISDSAFDVLGFGSNRSKTYFNNVGFLVSYNPFKNSGLSNITLTNSISIPLTKSKTISDKYEFEDNTLGYYIIDFFALNDIPLSDKFKLENSLGISTLFGDAAIYRIPINISFVYYVTESADLNINFSYLNNLSSFQQYEYNRINVGVGINYQIAKRFVLQMGLSSTVSGNNTGNGTALILGVNYLSF